MGLPKWYEMSAQMRSYESISHFYRKLTTRMPRQLLYATCHLSIPIYSLKKIPYLTRLLHNIVPISDHPDWRCRVLSTFNWDSPKYQHKHSNNEVLGWFEESGLIGNRILDFPVSVTGQKPPDTWQRLQGSYNED